MKNKKIKTFNHYNDEIINEFLSQTGGQIVNYNPIVIEYDANKVFKDPYEGYNAYFYKCRITFTPLDNIDKENYTFKDDKKVCNEILIDTVLFDKYTDELSFMRKGKIIYKQSSNDYLEIHLGLVKNESDNLITPVCTSKFGCDGSTNIAYNFHIHLDSDSGHSFFFEDYIKAVGGKQINYV